MSKKNKKSQKIKKDFKAGKDSISKYKKIVSEEFVPGRPGEELYEVTTDDGRKVFLSIDQKRELDKLKK